MSTALPPLPCYLNGTFSTIDKATVSVMDRGFIFGDGIYEVIPVYGGKPFGLDGHLARLERSLDEVRIKNPMDRAAWLKIATDLVAQYRDGTPAIGQKDSKLAENHLVYLQITRGVALRDHVMTEGIEPTVFAFANAMKVPSREQREQGVACVSADDFRWSKAHIKSTSLLGAVFSRQISFDQGAMETVMFRGDTLSEAAASNVWVVKDNKVLGPKKNSHVLEGIRFGLIERICQARGISFELRDISRAEVLAADEMMLSSATKEVLPITLLDGKAVGNGKPGAVYASVYAGYQELKAQ
jgi:D-alanine transaminase